MTTTSSAPHTLRAHRIGLWTAALDLLPPAAAQETAAELESLGYASLWIAEAYGRESLTSAQLLLGATRTMVVGTGIASIYARGAMACAAGARTLHAVAPGRFVLGLGVSHQPLVERDRRATYGPPLAAMRGYLDEMETAPNYSADTALPPVVLAALGPRMLGLARERAAGAHPYLVTPEHTAGARAVLGPDALLVVEQAAVLHPDRDEAVRRARAHLEIYTGLPNYRASWRREGFAEEDLVRGGSPRLVDALVALGDEAAVRARVRAHLDAGADHVCVQLLGEHPLAAPVDGWRALAPALAGLQPDLTR